MHWSCQDKSADKFARLGQELVLRNMIFCLVVSNLTNVSALIRGQISCVNGQSKQGLLARAQSNPFTRTVSSLPTAASEPRSHKSSEGLQRYECVNTESFIGVTRPLDTPSVLHYRQPSIRIKKVLPNSTA